MTHDQSDDFALSMTDRSILTFGTFGPRELDLSGLDEGTIIDDAALFIVRDAVEDVASFARASAFAVCSTSQSSFLSYFSSPIVRRPVFIFDSSRKC